MKLFFFFLLSIVTTNAFTQTSPILKPYLSKKQVLIILTPSEYHPKFKKQLIELKKIQYNLINKDLFIIKNCKGSITFANEHHLSKAENHHIYKYFGLTPKSFAVLIIDKNGNELVRTTDVISSEKVANAIDVSNIKMGLTGTKNNE